ncbi:MAG: hypothetical protein HQL52_09940 [Magnetococcales bacterium]|nr:hypothetical protein [Magnetococcales bacterium]
MRAVSGPKVGEGRRRSVKSGLLENQKIAKRVRKTPLATAKAPRTTTNTKEAPPAARRAAAPRPTTAPTSRFPWNRVLEGGFFVVAGLAMGVQKIFSILGGWLRGGYEEIEDLWKSRGNTSIEESGERMEPELEMAEAERLEPDLGMEEEEEWEGGFEPLKEDIESAKMAVLDEEEVGLPQEELEDQAARLRAMLTDSPDSDTHS